MKFLKILLIIVLVLLLGYVIACAMGPKRMDVTVTQEIDARPAVVYNQVANLKNWEKWSAWHREGENLEITYGDIEKGEGATYDWTMKGSAGNMKIVSATPPDSLRTRLQFEGWDGYSFGRWHFAPIGENQTEVTWNMKSDSDAPFFMRGFMLIMEGAMQNDFEQGLNNLKEVSEAAADEPLMYGDYEIKTTEYPAKTYLGIRTETSVDSLHPFYESSYATLMAYIQEKGYKMTGAPSGIYYEWDEENGRTDLAAAIPISGDSLEGTETIQVIEMDSGKVAMIAYYGDYMKMAEAHYAMDDYLKENNVEMAGPVLEEYVTDPGTEPDTTKWRTNIVYYVK